jgi:N-acetylmuramoyl-L-alanine amidase
VKLVVVIGHNKDQRGAMAVYPIASKEYDFNHKVALDIYRHCRSNNIECMVIDKSESTQKIVFDKVNKEERESVVVELHFNASDNCKARGTEVLYVDENSEMMAKSMQESLCLCLNRIGKQNRGVKKLTDIDRGFHNICGFEWPAILIEPFFGDNKEDSRLVYDRYEQYVESIVKGALDWTMN